MVKCPISHGESAMGQFPTQVRGARAFCRALAGHVRSIGTGPRNLCPIQASPHHVHLLDPGSPGSQFRKCCLSHVDGGNKNSNRQLSSAQQKYKNVQPRKSAGTQLRWRGRSRWGSQGGSHACPARRRPGSATRAHLRSAAQPVWGANGRTSLHRALARVLCAAAFPPPSPRTVLPQDRQLIPLPSPQGRTSAPSVP